MICNFISNHYIHIKINIDIKYTMYVYIEQIFSFSYIEFLFFFHIKSFSTFYYKFEISIIYINNNFTYSFDKFLTKEFLRYFIIYFIILFL